MNKTYFAKKSEVQRKWYLIDAKDKILGRIASRAAAILKGKHKVSYTPHIDTGDGVIIINSSMIRVTGKKMKQKIYRRYSGYPGGLKEIPLVNMLNSRPTTVMRLAVQRMLPGGPLGRRMLKKLKCYVDDKHGYKGQSPIILEV